MDRTCGTNSHTLTAQTALCVVDVRHVVLDGDSTKRALLRTLATTDTSSLTSLHGYRSFVFVDTRHEHSPTLRALLTQLNDVAWTSLDASPTSHTLLLVNLRESGLWVHVDGIKLTSGNTVATAQTAETTGCLTSTTRVHRCTRAQTAVLRNLRTQGTCSVTTHDGNLRFTIGNSHSQQVGYLAHYFLSAHRTHQPVEATSVSTFYQCISQTATSCEAASATVGSGQLLRHLGNARVFIDVELLGADKQY